MERPKEKIQLETPSIGDLTFTIEATNYLDLDYREDPIVGGYELSTAADLTANSVLDNRRVHASIDPITVEDIKKLEDDGLLDLSLESLQKARQEKVQE